MNANKRYEEVIRLESQLVRTAANVNPLGLGQNNLNKARYRCRCRNRNRDATRAWATRRLPGFDPPRRLCASLLRQRLSITVSITSSTTEITLAIIAPPASDTMLAVTAGVSPVPVMCTAVPHTITAAMS